MISNDAGRMLAAVWESIPERFPNVQLDAFVVMPNHIHGVILLPETDVTRAPDVGARETAESATPSLGDVIGAFKSMTTVEYIRAVKAMRWPSLPGRLWQRNYYEHVIRDESDLNRVRRYIDENPLRWDLDEENPRRVMP